MIKKATDLAFSVSSASFVAFGFSLCQKITLDSRTYIGRHLCGPLPALCPQHLIPGTDFFIEVSVSRGVVLRPRSWAGKLIRQNIMRLS